MADEPSGTQNSRFYSPRSHLKNGNHLRMATCRAALPRVMNVVQCQRQVLLVKSTLESNADAGGTWFESQDWPKMNFEAVTSLELTIPFPIGVRDRKTKAPMGDVRL